MMTSEISTVPSTIYAGVSTQAVAQPEAVVLSGPGVHDLTYNRLREHLESTQFWLRARGIGRGTAVALVMPNGPEAAAAFLGIAGTAAVAPLNPSYRAPEFDFYLGDLGARAVIVAADLATPARDVAAARGIPVIELISRSAEGAGLFELEGGVPTAAAGGLAEPGDTALILHTSGTTSRPKMVPLTQANLCASARHVGASLQLSPTDRCLNVMPLFHIHGLVAAVLASVAAGGSVVCTPGFIATQFFDWLEASRPTWYTAVPTMHQAVLARAADHRAVIGRSSLRFIRSSSASLPPAVMAELEATFGVPVIEAYGMTEAAHQMTSNPLPPGVRKPGSVGLPAGPEVGVIDAEGRMLAPGRVGEVVIRGPNVSAGYAQNPAATAQAFTEGWFRTGDQGYQDADGYLYLTGRLKEIINRGGETIAPREIDEVLLDHPAVAQALAFALPDERLGEEVAAAVVLQPGAAATERELRSFVAGHLADYKVPVRIVFLDEIPKGPTGKLQRIGMAERLGLLEQGANEASPVRPFTPPETLAEKVLAETWSEVLRRDSLSVHDHFIDLGGDSVLATQLVARLRMKTGIKLTLLDLFDAPTIAEQAAILEEKLLDEAPPPSA